MSLLLLPSLQVPGRKTESATMVTPLSGKPGNTSGGVTYAGPLKTGGIQIKLSPAPETATSQTKMPPKMCFKVIGKESKESRNQKLKQKKFDKPCWLSSVCFFGFALHLQYMTNMGNLTLISNNIKNINIIATYSRFFGSPCATRAALAP